MVELEVAGVDDEAAGGTDGQAHRVGDAVADAEELDVDVAELDVVARADLVDRGLLEQAPLLEFDLHEPRGEGRCVDGDVDVADQIGDRADVVLVAVRDHDRPQFLPTFEDVGEVGDDDVDARGVEPGGT